MRPRLMASLSGLATVLAVGAAAFATSGGAAASAGVWHPRPAAQHHSSAAAAAATPVPVTNVDNQFHGARPAGWCGTEVCNGKASISTWGTLDTGIPSGFSNSGFGNYAPSTPALFETKMALISGTTMANQGLGCQTPGAEGCTGPYYAPAVAQNTFPGNGFTVTNDVYLDPAATPATAGEIDLDVALNDSTGSFAQDNIIAVCNQGGGTGYSVTFGHNSPGNCSGSPVITTAGWYRFVWVFSNAAGKVYLTQRVLAESNLTAPPIADSGQQPVQFPGSSSTELTSQVGGIAYFWYPTLNIQGMPMGNFAIQTGQHASGHTPS